MRKTLFSQLTTAVLLMLPLASQVIAQDDTPANAPKQNSAIAYGVGIICVIAIIAVSIMSAKRSHQD